MSAEPPSPEAAECVERRIRGTVASVLAPEELVGLRLTWVTPSAPAWAADTGEFALRLVVSAVRDEVFSRDLWGHDWEGELVQLAGDLEDWVSETSFGWGEERTATVPP